MLERNLEIQGLSVRQSIIADALWECQTESEIQIILEVFPVSEVELVKELMIAAALDCAVQEPDASVHEYLLKFNRRK